MKVEKRATNKIGLIFFWILVIAGLAGGGYYLYTHKDSLNIDWNITLPWNKDKTQEQDNASGANNIKRNERSNTTTGFVDPTNVQTPLFNHSGSCTIYMEKIETNKKEIIFNYRVSNIPRNGENPANRHACKIEVTRIAVNYFPISNVFEVSLPEYGTEKTGQIAIKRSELEQYEINGIKTLTFFYKEYNLLKPNEEAKYSLDLVTVNSIKTFEDNLAGLTFDTIGKTKFDYYKTITDKDSTYIYFIINNIEGIRDVTIKVKKLLINGKNYNVPKVECEVLHNLRNIFYIEIPKSEFKKVNSFNVSFFMIEQVGEKTYNYYLSNEYSKEL